MRTKIGSIIGGKAGEIYTKILAGINSYTSAHDFVSKAYSTYATGFISNPSINGRVLEYCVCETLVREGITPFYYQAKFTFAPIVEYDIVCYHPRTPVVLSVKTSLRERYKQAVLEGVVLKGIYGAAQSYLLTMSDEFKGVRKKIEEEAFVGLADCLRVDSPEYGDLIKKLKAIQFVKAEPVTPLSGRVVS